MSQQKAKVHSTHRTVDSALAAVRRAVREEDVEQARELIARSVAAGTPLSELRDALDWQEAQAGSEKGTEREQSKRPLKSPELGKLPASPSS